MFSHCLLVTVPAFGDVGTLFVHCHLNISRYKARCAAHFNDHHHFSVQCHCFLPFLHLCVLFHLLDSVSPFFWFAKARARVTWLKNNDLCFHIHPSQHKSSTLFVEHLFIVWCFLALHRVFLSLFPGLKWLKTAQLKFIHPQFHFTSSSHFISLLFPAFLHQIAAELDSGSAVVTHFHPKSLFSPFKPPSDSCFDHSCNAHTSFELLNTYSYLSWWWFPQWRGVLSFISCQNGDFDMCQGMMNDKTPLFVIPNTFSWLLTQYFIIDFIFVGLCHWSDLIHVLCGVALSFCSDKGVLLQYHDASQEFSWTTAPNCIGLCLKVVLGMVGCSSKVRQHAFFCVWMLEWFVPLVPGQWMTVIISDMHFIIHITIESPWSVIQQWLKQRELWHLSQECVCFCHWSVVAWETRQVQSKKNMRGMPFDGGKETKKSWQHSSSDVGCDRVTGLDWDAWVKPVAEWQATQWKGEGRRWSKCEWLMWACWEDPTRWKVKKEVGLSEWRPKQTGDQPGLGPLWLFGCPPHCAWVCLLVPRLVLIPSDYTIRMSK